MFGMLRGGSTIVTTHTTQPQWECWLALAENSNNTTRTRREYGIFFPLFFCSGIGRAGHAQGHHARTGNFALEMR